MMKCQKCGTKTRVIGTMDHIRKRRCLKCGHTATTEELWLIRAKPDKPLTHQEKCELDAATKPDGAAYRAFNEAMMQRTANHGRHKWTAWISYEWWVSRGCPQVEAVPDRSNMDPELRALLERQ